MDTKAAVIALATLLVKYLAQDCDHSDLCAALVEGMKHGKDNILEGNADSLMATLPKGLQESVFGVLSGEEPVVGVPSDEMVPVKEKKRRPRQRRKPLILARRSRFFLKTRRKQRKRSRSRQVNPQHPPMNSNLSKEHTNGIVFAGTGSPRAHEHRASHCPRPVSVGSSRMRENLSGMETMKSMGLPSWIVTLDEDRMVQELLGHYIPKGGEFVWHDGPVSLAVRKGGLIINELPRASGAVKDMLLSVLDNPGSFSISLPTART